MLRSTVILLTSLMLCTYVAAQCGQGEQLCNDATMGPTCYDPSIYTCPSGSRGTILCGNQEHGPDGACGLTCYDMTLYQCCNEQLYDINNPVPCAATTQAPATSSPTSPPVGTSPTDSQSSCADFECAAGLSCCDDVRMGPTCYDSNTYTCPTGSRGPILCGNQEHGPDGACGLICYDMVDYQCCNEQLYQAGATTPCSQTNPTQPPATSSPTQFPGDTHGSSSPPVGTSSTAPTESQSTCGDFECAAGLSCCDDVRMGPTCYDSNTYTCPTGSQGPILCGNQEHGPDGACGLICYDMTDYQCCNDQLYQAGATTPCSETNPTQPPVTSSPTSPPVGTSPTDSQPTCGDYECAAGLSCCDDVRMGPTCYDPNTYTCPTGSKGPILCGNQEHGPDGACGLICYDMVDYQCCNDQLYGSYQSTPCSQTSGQPTPGTSAPTTGLTQAPTQLPATTQPTSQPGGSCGNLQCGDGAMCCDDVNLGPTCYDPSTYTCPTGSVGPILCGNQEHGPDGACGTVCYDMVDYKCCNDQLYGVNDAYVPC